jgi:hypothetical protein
VTRTSHSQRWVRQVELHITSSLQRWVVLVDLCMTSASPYYYTAKHAIYLSSAEVGEADQPTHDHESSTVNRIL